MNQTPREFQVNLRIWPTDGTHAFDICNALETEIGAFLEDLQASDWKDNHGVFMHTELVNASEVT